MGPLETVQPVRETFFNTLKNKRDIPDDKVRREIPRIIRTYIHKMYNTYISVQNTLVGKYLLSKVSHRYYLLPKFSKSGNFKDSQFLLEQKFRESGGSSHVTDTSRADNSPRKIPPRIEQFHLLKR